MGVGYKPIIMKKDGVVRVFNQEGEELGLLRWRDEWECYQYVTPDEHVYLGPAFLTALATEMMILEIEKRKGDE